ncbi:MAG: hypothetical protein Q7S90_04245 [Rubrivivax sp.]|nr:hypothetical protein [Rubrivivax sp.]
MFTVRVVAACRFVDIDDGPALRVRRLEREIIRMNESSVHPQAGRAALGAAWRGVDA